MASTQKQILESVRVIIACYDRSTSPKDFTDQVAAHIEDLRIMVRTAERAADKKMGKRIEKSDREHFARVTSIQKDRSAAEIFEAGRLILEKR